ncbi:MAG: hypothetical protein ACTHQQ_02970, partial [Solirubrobacteraceae bacterium]
MRFQQPPGHGRATAIAGQLDVDQQPGGRRSLLGRGLQDVLDPGARLAQTALQIATFGRSPLEERPLPQETELQHKRLGEQGAGLLGVLGGALSSQRRLGIGAPLRRQGTRRLEWR